MSDDRFKLTPEDFLNCFINGWIVDARDGGLIVGRLHEEGHITMIEGTEEFGVYAHVGFVEGGEFIMSTDATRLHRRRLEEINADKSPCEDAIRVSTDSQIINARAEPHDKFIVIQRQFIINREATKRHFKELEDLNRPHRYYRGRVLPDEVIELITEPGYVRY